VKISDAWIRIHDRWVLKRVRYTHYVTAPQDNELWPPRKCLPPKRPYGNAPRAFHHLVIIFIIIITQTTFLVTLLKSTIEGRIVKALFQQSSLSRNSRPCLKINDVRLLLATTGAIILQNLQCNKPSSQRPASHSAQQKYPLL